MATPRIRARAIRRAGELLKQIEPPKNRHHAGGGAPTGRLVRRQGRRHTTAGCGWSGDSLNARSSFGQGCDGIYLAGSEFQVSR